MILLSKLSNWVYLDSGKDYGAEKRRQEEKLRNEGLIPVAQSQKYVVVLRKIIEEEKKNERSAEIPHVPSHRSLRRSSSSPSVRTARPPSSPPSSLDSLRTALPPSPEQVDEQIDSSPGLHRASSSEQPRSEPSRDTSVGYTSSEGPGSPLHQWSSVSFNPDKGRPNILKKCLKVLIN